MNTTPYGFRIVGATWEARRLVDAAAAFRAYAECDPRAECNKEGYLSAFQFGEDFRLLLTDTGSTAGFSGPCWSPAVWFDIDSDELHYAHKDATALVAILSERYEVAETELSVFFSGSKGFHVGLPTGLWSVEPSELFHRTARRFAENVAELASVTIDVGVYDAVRAFRAPNSRHPKTGLFKRWLAADELFGRLDRIFELAREPAPFKMPSPSGTSDQAIADWQAASDQVRRETEVKTARRATGASTTLNRQTLDFIRHGADHGDRHRLLFSAAANLGEFGCSSELAVALLEEPALDSGLPPKDVRRQIDCGLATVSTPEDVPESPQAAKNDQPPQEHDERNTGDSAGSQGQSCQEMTKTTESSTVDLQDALAQLWRSAEPSDIRKEAASPQPDDEGIATDPQSARLRPPLPPPPPPFIPLPPKAVGSGELGSPCRCGSTEYADVAISGGRIRRDCRKCGRFIEFARWHDEGEAL